MHIYIPGINYTKYIFMYIHINVAVFWVLVACLARVQYFCGSRGKACFVCAGMHINNIIFYVTAVVHCGSGSLWREGSGRGSGGSGWWVLCWPQQRQCFGASLLAVYGSRACVFLVVAHSLHGVFFFVSSLWQARQLK